MAQLNTYTCDICGAIKKESNHWFMARKRPNFFEAFVWNIDARHTPDQPLYHICGTECLTKFMLRSMILSQAPKTEIESSGS